MSYTTADNPGDGNHPEREKPHICCLAQTYADVRKHTLIYQS